MIANRRSPLGQQQYPFDDRRTVGSTGPGHAFSAMSGPEFDPGSVWRGVAALPPRLVLPVVGALILFAAGACAGVGLSRPAYVPSPDVCRSIEASVVAPVEPAGSCVRQEATR